MGHHHPHGPRRPLRADLTARSRKWYRDAKIYQIFEGTAQVQRLVVSRMQRREYQERLKEAAEVLEQVPSVAATAA